MAGDDFEIISNEGVSMIQEKQRYAKGIVADEINRLQLKKDNMDFQTSNADRMIVLNQSFRDRQQQYLMIMFLFLVTFGISLAIVFLQEKLGITSIFMDLLLIIIVGTGLFLGVYMISNILVRDPIEFSKLKQTGGILRSVPEKSSVAAANAAASASGDLTRAVATVCRGAECCGPGFTYNTGTKQCA
jgi:hypothetical protein